MRPPSFSRRGGCLKSAGPPAVSCSELVLLRVLMSSERFFLVAGPGMRHNWCGSPQQCVESQPLLLCMDQPTLENRLRAASGGRKLTQGRVAAITAESVSRSAYASRIHRTSTVEEEDAGSSDGSSGSSVGEHGAPPPGRQRGPSRVHSAMHLFERGSDGAHGGGVHPEGRTRGLSAAGIRCMHAVACSREPQPLPLSSFHTRRLRVAVMRHVLRRNALRSRGWPLPWCYSPDLPAVQ